MFETPYYNCLNQASFENVYPPSEDSFLLIDALEKDKSFINTDVRPCLAVEVGSGSGIISTFLSKIVDKPCSFLCFDISPVVSGPFKIIYRHA